MGLLPKLRPSSASKVASHSESAKRASITTTATTTDAGETSATRAPTTASRSTNAQQQHDSSHQSRSKQTRRQVLAGETQRVKAAVLAAHAGAQPFVRFSFSRMRHKATPPVQIPEKVADPRALRMCVGGRKVPYTRGMHANLKRKAKKRDLGIIDEYVEY